MEKSIKGSFRKTIFKSQNGYTVGLVKVRGTTDKDLEDYVNKTITITGTFFELNEDDMYHFYGNLVKTDKYGIQYQVLKYERIKPEGKDGIIEFLSSDLFKGVGEKTAEKIVEVLKEDSLKLILESYENLLDIPKMTEKKAIKIHETLSKYEESHTTIVYLCDLGFSMKDALNIYNVYKSNTISNIDYNIYNLIEDIPNINFKKVDEIALKKGIEKYNENRVKAILLYTIKSLCFKTGNTCLEINEIVKEISKISDLLLSKEKTIEYLEILNDEEKIVIKEEKFFLRELYENEIYIAEKILNLNRIKIKGNKNIDNNIDNLENHFNITYNKEQKIAIKEAIKNNFLIITGGPGTGKTTIINGIVELYKKMNNYTYESLCEKIALLAPTGRAAKRIAESTLLPACTIHRFLKWNKETNDFQINEHNKDDSEFIIIDEVSMIDTNLFANLLKGLKDNVKIIMVGDFNQLPSVGEGQILKDLIDSKVLNVIKLETLYRQGNDSYIIDLAYDIKDGELKTDYLNKKSDYNFIESNNDSIKKNIELICIKALEKNFDYKKIQILAPIYRGVNGIENLNVMLQRIFNKKSKDKKEIYYGEYIYRENDKIIQLVNMPDENVFNGDIGIIKEIKKANEDGNKKNEIFIDFDGNIVKYTPKDFINIKHGYAISIHKSQGSEYDMVIMPISKSYYSMLYRKLIYTGVTRAKKYLMLVGDKEAFVKGVKNENETPRRSNLKENLINFYE